MTLEKKRLRVRVVTAAMLGFIVSVLIEIRIGMPFGVGLFLGCCAALASAISIFIMWRKLVKSGETRAKGALYCGLAGLLAAWMTGLFVALFSGVIRLFTGGATGTGFIEWLLYALLVQPIMAAIIGGVFAVPIGAIAGFAMSKNPRRANTVPSS